VGTALHTSTVHLPQSDIAFAEPGAHVSIPSYARAAKKLNGRVQSFYPQNVFNDRLRLSSKNHYQATRLKGKRLGVYSLESGTRSNLRIILRAVAWTRKDVNLPTGVLNFGPLMQARSTPLPPRNRLWARKQQGLGDVHIIWPVIISIPRNRAFHR